MVQAKVLSTGKEYSLTLAGKGAMEGRQLESYVKTIQKLKLAHYERIDLLLERAKRMYTEVEEGSKPHMQSILSALEQINKGGSIRKANARLDEIEAVIDEIEESLKDSDIFHKTPVFLRVIKGGTDE